MDIFRHYVQAHMRWNRQPIVTPGQSFWYCLSVAHSNIWHVSFIQRVNNPHSMTHRVVVLIAARGLAMSDVLPHDWSTSRYCQNHSDIVSYFNHLTAFTILTIVPRVCLVCFLQLYTDFC